MARDDMIVRRGTAVKMLDKAQRRIGGYLAAWGNAEERDLDGEYFTPDTEFELDGKKALPVLFHHGMDETLKARPIGVIESWKKDDIGLWVEGILAERDEYIAAIERLIDEGYLAWSSGSMPHQVRIENGQIKYWPVYEGSATHIPADWRGWTRVEALKSVLAEDALAGCQRERRKDSTADDEVKTMEITNEIRALIASVLAQYAADNGLTPTEEELMQYVALVESAMQGTGDVEALQKMVEDDPESEESDLVEQLAEAVAEIVEPYVKRVLSPRIKARKLAEAVRRTPKAVERFNVNRGVPNTGIADYVRRVVSAAGDGRAFKAQSSQIGALGGFVTASETSQNIIEYLHAKQVVMALGAEVINITGLEQLTLLRNTQANTAYFVGENAQIPASDMRFSTIVVTPKQLASRIAVPNRLLKNSAVDLERYIVSQMQQGLAARMDKACLVDDGGIEAGATGVSPVGLRHTAGVTKTELGSGNGAEVTIDDLVAMERRIAEDNVPLVKPGYAFAPRTRYKIATLKDNQGNPVMRATWGDEAYSRLLGHPWVDTTNIPVNETVGTSTDCSTVYFGTWNEFVIAMNSDIEIIVNPWEAQSYDQTYITAMMMFGPVVCRPEAFEILTGVR